MSKCDKIRVDYRQKEVVKMANVIDYLLWRGDLPFSKEHCFNEIDSLILARFSYLIFDKIKMNPKETIASISRKMSSFPEDAFLYKGDKDLIVNLGKSTRFKDLLVTDCIVNKDKSIERQFGAITIHLSNREIYVSFLGTDFSILGWKEDFNMMFLENVPCQLAGKEYLKNICKKYPGRKVRVGGHSKGGNVAIFSAITSSKRIQNRIIKVYNYDGPGFRKEVLKKYQVKDFLKKIETYIPQDSIVGKLLYHNEKTSITYSVEKGILQHDIYSWQVLKDDLIYSSKSTENSEVVDKTITKWFEETTNEQRKIVVETIFDLFYSTDSETFEEMSKNFTKKLPLVMKKYNEVSKEDKDMIVKTIKMMIGIYMEVVKENETKKLKSNIKKLGKPKQK